MNTDVCPDLHQQVMNTLSLNLRTASDYFQIAFSWPTIDYGLKGSAAGVAILQGWQIRLNSVLLAENKQTFIDQVIPHELAHLLVWQQFGKVAPHGKQWRWMMEKVLGVTARRTHNFAIDSVRVKTFTYHCTCQLHQLSIRRHNRVQRQQSLYLCRRCRQPLIIGNAQSLK